MNRVAVILLAAAGLALGALPEQSVAPRGLSTPAAEASRSTVTVLGYGHFADATNPGGMDAATFRRQMLYLKKHGITPVSLRDFLAWRAGEKTLPTHAALVTLDEADTATAQVAIPILKELQIPFVLFVDSRSFQGSGRCMTTADLAAAVDAGGAIGCHTATRPAGYEWQFAAVSGEMPLMQEKELGRPAEGIRAAFGSCEALSYPRGLVAPGMKEGLSRYGYQVAFDGMDGKVTRHTEAFRQHRYMISGDETFARAVNFGAEAETPAILLALRGKSVAPAAPQPAPSHLTEAPKPLPVASVVQQPAPLPTESAEKTTEHAPSADVFFADDDTAEELEPEEMVSPVPAASPAPSSVAAPENLMKRTPDGDWVTRSFAAPLVPREETRVAVLGYHNFSNTKKVTEMRMPTADFCQQMQYIRDAGLSVITMEDFLEWLRGDRQLPERCVLITIDDGWKSVYTDAYPVLKAYGYPFTLFLYTRYIQVHGDSMTEAQIKEMMAAGATIGSHSTSHLYPRSWKRYAQTSEAYKKQVQTEIPDSCTKLKSLFGNCSAYCYPGGYNTPPMLECLRSSAFRAAFTVMEAKVTAQEDPYLVHRYMVFGVDPKIFRRAVNFDGELGIKPTEEGIHNARAKARAFFPQAFEGIAE